MMTDKSSSSSTSKTKTLLDEKENSNELETNEQNKTVASIKSMWILATIASSDTVGWWFSDE